MNNLNHANDKNKAPLCDSLSKGNQFKNRMHYFKNLLRHLESSYEGFYCAQRYANADIPEHFREEGKLQQEFYIQKIEEIFSELENILHTMRHKLNMEGE